MIPGFGTKPFEQNNLRVIFKMTPGGENLPPYNVETPLIVLVWLGLP